MELMGQTTSVLLLILGFGFVIFFHELGHFLAAKWVGIRVEQFAVGFGQAIVAWRKGVGFAIGSTRRKVEEARRQARAGSRSGGSHAETETEAPPAAGPGAVAVAAQTAVAPASMANESDEQIDQRLGISETEYRLNWLPLGGYVKMLGQDDLNPNSQVEDPRAYNKKSVGARMVVVSAGVIMNIILAAIGFMIVFMVGFPAPPAVVGEVFTGAPAQQAGLQVGDRIRYIDGQYQHDFTKIPLAVALAAEDEPLTIVVERAGTGMQEELTFTPRRKKGDKDGFLALGITPPYELKVVKNENLFDQYAIVSEEMKAFQPEDVITHVNGQPVGLKDIHLLDQAVQGSQGRPLTLTVQRGRESLELPLTPHFQRPFDSTELNLAGMTPRQAVSVVNNDSPAKDHLQFDDVVLAVRAPNGDTLSHPTFQEFSKWTNDAADAGKPVIVEVLRDGQVLTLPPIEPVKLGPGNWGLKIGLGYDAEHPVVSQVAEGSPADQAGIKKGATITAIDQQPVRNWFQILSALRSATPDQPLTISFRTAEGVLKENVPLALSAEQIAEARNVRFDHPLDSILQPLNEPRKADNVFQAAWWGVTETRDFIMQFYVTLQRMFEGSVSYKNMMGPVGIFSAGTTFAFKGTVWLIWFLSMISANLAVVNFLPIPIVDGGLFTFLIVEKVQGRPVSARTQAIAQVIGLALILGIFLLVTYQDIARILWI